MNDLPDADAGQAELLELDGQADHAPPAADDDPDEDQDRRGTGS